MYNLDGVRPVWAEINLDNLAYNVREIRKGTEENALVTAVVKANAYGHGSIEAGRVFLKNGADRLAVATLSEAIELRKADIEAPILILGYTSKEQFPLLLEWNIMQTLFDYENAKAFSEEAVKLDKKAIIHIKIDSGMGRLGFLPNEDSVDEIIKISKLPNVNIEGIFTHFATADEKDKKYTKLQYERFKYVVDKVEEKGLHIPLKHVSNSASIIDFPDYALGMVRAGILIYGYIPSGEVDKYRVKYKPAMTLKTKISHIKKVQKGTGISYGKTFVTEKESTIATIPIGYADGLTRMLASKGEVCIDGKRVAIVGRICMDQCMIDITDMEDVKVGDEAIIFGYEEGCPTVGELADMLGTIDHEILCMVGRRVPRVYIENDEIIEVKDYLLE